jgi:putative tricarboxylic transport membrane protein
MENLIHGFTIVTHGQALAFLFAGAILGMVLGMIPGISVVVILSIILIFAFSLDLTASLALFLGVECGGFYSASVAAILLNAPPHPEAMPIALDGYPMARTANPGRALGISAASTCIGGLIGCAVLIGFLQIIDDLPNVFHPPEYAALIILAMLLVGTLGTNSIGKAVAAAGLGLLASSVGPSAITGTLRYTWGSVALQGGISLVAIALGMLVLPQMTMVFGTGTATAWQDMTGKEMADAEAAAIERGGYRKAVMAGVLETFHYWKTLLLSGIVGGVTGMIPGIGGFAGNYMAYGIAKQTSRNRDLFGTGTPEGIIAPEGSSLAKEAGHIIPLVGLGIPGGIAGALFIGLLTIKDVKPGYGFQQANPNITGEIVWIIALAGLIGTVTGVLIGPRIAHAARIPGPLLVPFVFFISVAGVFITDQLMFSVIELVLFMVIGLVLRRLRYPLGGLILGFVLGQTLETNIYLTGQIYHGFGFVPKRPIADVICALAIIVLLAKAREIRRGAAERKAELAGDLAVHDGSVPIDVRRLQLLDPYPLLAVVTDACLTALSIFALVWALVQYDTATRMLPLIAASAVAVPSIVFLPRDLRRYLILRKAHAANAAEVLVTQAVAVSSGGPQQPGAAVSSIATVAGSTSTVTKRSWGRRGQYRRELGAVAWLVALVGLSWLLGFELGGGIFMAAYGIVATGNYFKSRYTHITFVVLSTAVMVWVTHLMFQLTAISYTPVIHF